MSAKGKKAVPQGRILKVGETYLDRSRGVLVTMEDHEIAAGRRTGRVIVCAADGVLRFPRRWYCRAPDLVEPPRSGSPSHGGVHP
jgi:hypothetical protein